MSAVIFATVLDYTPGPHSGAAQARPIPQGPASWVHACMHACNITATVSQASEPV